MVNTIATFALGALVAAFALAAVLLNEGEHAARRRMRARRPGSSPPASEVDVDLLHLSGSEPSSGGDRRLAVGDFLFGALALRGSEPFPTSELAARAGDSGLDVNQVLAWLAGAEEGGLVERLDRSEEHGSPEGPCVRLTPEGLDVARENRRAAYRTARTGL